MAGRFKWRCLAFFSISALFGAWYARKAAIVFSKFLKNKEYSITMETAVLSSQTRNGFQPLKKRSMFSLFETLFNKKPEVIPLSISYLFQAPLQFHIKHPDVVRRKLTRMIALGKDNLQVIQ